LKFSEFFGKFHLVKLKKGKLMNLQEFQALIAQQREAQRKENLAKSQALFATLSKDGK
jgi:hypothetical protein